jgi:hypothetical protein
MDAASGKEHLVPGTSVLPAFEFGTAITAIGSRWIAGDAMAYHGQRPFYLDWHTGRVVVEPRESATNIGTLDLPLVRHNLCGPLRRIRNTEVWGPPFEPLLYSPPFAVDQTHRAGEYTRLRLLHCGSSRSELLPSTETWGPQLGGDVLSWVASGKNESPFVTRLYPNGPRWHGPLFQLVGPHQPYETGTERVRWSRPQHTSTSIYLTEDQWEAPTYKITSTLWSARIP